MNKKCFSWYHSLAAIWAASWHNKQNGMCAQRRLRSAWASAQSDQSLRCALNGYVCVLAFFKRTAKTLIRLGGCPGWSESSLGANSFSWFWHVVAQFCDCGTPWALRFVIVEFPGMYIVYFLSNIHDLCTANEQLPNASVQNTRHTNFKIAHSKSPYFWMYTTLKLKTIQIIFGIFKSMLCQYNLKTSSKAIWISARFIKPESWMY